MECMLASRCTAKHIKKFLKRPVYLVCAQASERGNGKTAESCGDKQCMGVRVLDISLSLLRSLFPLLFVHSIASLLLLILFLILFFLRSSQFLYHRSRFTLIPRFSFISYLYNSQRSSAYVLSLLISLQNKILIRLKTKRRTILTFKGFIT